MPEGRHAPRPEEATPDARAPGQGEDEPSAAGEPPRWQQAAELFGRWRAGETRAMDDLVRLMTPTLWHVARAYGLSPSAAEDVVQTTWLTFVRKHDSVLDPTAVSAWLTVTARREAWRTSRVDSRSNAMEDERLEPRLPAQRSAEDEAVEAVASEGLWHAVEQLDERCRRLLRIVAFDDRPDYRRIAADLRMPIGSIGPTRGRCLAKLRALIVGHGEEAGA